MDLEPKIVRQISKNITKIKQQVSVLVDPIVDILIEEEVVSLDIKQEIDAIPRLTAKVDFLIRTVRHKGPDECHVFLKAMEINGLGHLAEEIKKTAVPATKSQIESTTVSAHTETRGSERTEGDGVESRTEPVPPLRLQDGNTDNHNANGKSTSDLESRFRELEIENKTFRENMVHELRGELSSLKDSLQREQETMRAENQNIIAENEKLRAANKELQDKFIALESEFKTNQEKLKQSDETVAITEAQFEDMNAKHMQLEEDLNNFKQLCCAGSNLQQDERQRIIQEIESRYGRLNQMMRSMNSKSGRVRASQANNLTMNRNPVLPNIGQSSKPRQTTLKRWEPSHT